MSKSTGDMSGVDNTGRSGQWSYFGNKASNEAMTCCPKAKQVAARKTVEGTSRLIDMRDEIKSRGWSRALCRRYRPKDFQSTASDITA